MKTPALFVLLLLLGFFAGCATPDTTALHVGMTKDEVIQVLGKPATTGGSEEYEYFNYILSSSNAGSDGIRMNRAYYVRFANGKVESFGYAGEVPTKITTTYTYRSTTTPAVPAASTPLPPPAVDSFTTPAEHATATDGVRFLSMEPAVLVPGQPTDVKIKVRYSLRSAPHAELHVDFNVASPVKWWNMGTQLIDRGTGEAEISGKVTATDWGDLTDFRTLILLRPYPATAANSNGRFNLANQEVPIALQKDGTAKAAAANVAHDAIRIIAVEPTELVPGEPTDVKVKIKYVLKSTDQGNIDVTFNLSGPNRWFRIGQQIVSNGTGEVEITGHITPRSWGELTDFTAAAHLTEYPGTGTPPGLATTERAVPLKISPDTPPPAPPGSAAGSGGAIYNPKDLDQPVERIAPAQPVYPAEEKRLGHGGRVVVDFVVTSDGRVEDAHVVDSTNAALNDAAVDAVLRSKFTPGHLSGRNVASRVSVPFVFSVQ